MKTRISNHNRFDLPLLNDSLIRDPDHYPTFDIAHASQINEHLSELISIKENRDFFFSIFLDLTSDTIEHDLREMVDAIAQGLDDESLYWLFQAESCLLDLIGNRLRDAHKGLAIHFRGGSASIVKAIAFHIPVRTWACADRSPNLVPLIEMRDSYDRYVVMISDAHHARVLEIAVGSVTREAWLSHPELGKKIGSEWALEHYRDYHPSKPSRVVSECVPMLETLMLERSYGHLILAGDSEHVAQIEAVLPPWLRKRLVDVCNLSIEDGREHIVERTIRSFVEQEAYESRTTLDRLWYRTLQSGHDSALGLDACEEALKDDLVETLVMTKSVERTTGYMRVFRHKTKGGNYLTVEKRRQRLLNAAIEQGVQIEFVDRDSFLDDCLGVGAILRFDPKRPKANAKRKAA